MFQEQLAIKDPDQPARRAVVDGPEAPNDRVSAGKKEGVGEVIEPFASAAVPLVCPASAQDHQSRRNLSLDMEVAFW